MYFLFYSPLIKCNVNFSYIFNYVIYTFFLKIKSSESEKNNFTLSFEPLCETFDRRERIISKKKPWNNNSRNNSLSSFSRARTERKFV